VGAGGWPSASVFTEKNEHTRADSRNPEGRQDEAEVAEPGQHSRPKRDANHQQEKLKLFEELATKGFLTRVPGKTGVRTGLGFGITEKGEAELKLLNRHPGVAAK
jgi:hypothetical protein